MRRSWRAEKAAAITTNYCRSGTHERLVVAKKRGGTKQRTTNRGKEEITVKGWRTQLGGEFGGKGWVCLWVAKCGKS